MKRNSNSIIVAFAVLLAACSGGDVSQSVADTWPAKWCQAQPGISKAQLVAIMGQPTTDVDSSMSWSAHQYQFNAFLDSDGTVKQLDINRHALSDAERAALECSATRVREI